MALRTPLSVTPHLYMGDSTGRPLDMGTVYFGEQNKDPEFYPINLFSDDALTLPLAQPVHTKGGYLYDKGDMVEPHAKELIYSVKVLDSYGRKVFYKGAMMRNSWNDDVIQQINAAIVASTDIARQVATDITNDAINNTAVEGGVLADTFVTVTPSGVGTVARTQREKNSEIISVKDFGAIGDGVTDDTNAIKSALESGLSIDWGDSRDTYLVSTFIEATLTKDIVWVSRGAKILLDAPSHKNLVIRLYLNGCNFTLNGSLTIDANLKAQSGFLLSNANNTESDVDITGLTVENAYRRAGFTFGGDGINIRGNYGRVSLQNPTIKNIVLEAGAGVSGSVGVSGITIHGDPSDPSFYPKTVTITNPIIESIRSEDLLYFSDQDGIKVFTNVLTNDSVTETISTITGGTFKNCYGRSIKSQCENTIVSNCHFIRTEGTQLTDLPDSTRNLNPEVDFQLGAGVLSNCTFLYDGHKPYGLVKSSPLRTSSETKDGLTNLVTISNIKGTVVNQPDNLGLQYTLFTLNNSTIGKSLFVSSVSISSDNSGSSDCFIQTANSINTRIFGSISNVVGSFRAAFHRSQSSLGIVDLDYSNIRNIGDIIPFYSGVAATTDGSYISIVGFENNETSYVLSIGKKPLIPRVSGIRPSTGNSTLSGAMGIQSHFIADETEVTLDNYGTADNTGVVIMHVSYVADASVMISTSHDSIFAMTDVDETRVNLATTSPSSKPTTGRIRIYLKDGKTTVSNHTGSSRVFTFITLG